MQGVEEAERRDLLAELPTGVEDRRPFGGLDLLTVDLDFDHALLGLELDEGRHVVAPSKRRRRVTADWIAL